MRLIKNPGRDVYYNLALEEYVMENYTQGEYLILWVNDRSIVLGKNQNVFEEANVQEAERQNIKIARRNSGGGTVYHDRGNLNYSIITDYDAYRGVNYDMCLEPVLKALHNLGIPAHKQRNCDIAIDGKKISGSAQQIKKKRLLHHGTLLFDADLSSLAACLQGTSGSIKSKSVKSVRSPVTNIKDYITDREMDIAGFAQAIADEIVPGNAKVIFSPQEKKQISELADNKYRTWQWNYGYSPKFVFEKKSSCAGYDCKVTIAVVQGIITNCVVECEKFPNNNIGALLTGQKYSYQTIKEQLANMKGYGILLEGFF